MFKNLDLPALGINATSSETVELTLTYKFKYRDLDLLAFAEQVEKQGIARARQLIGGNRVQAGTFPLPIEWDVDDATFLENLKSLLPFAQTAVEMGCRCCQVRLPGSHDVRPYHENFDFTQRRLSDVGNVLGQLGINLTIGFHAAPEHRAAQTGNTYDFIRDFDALTKLVELINCPSVRVLVDVWDLLVGGGSLENLKSLPGEKIGSVCLADMPTEEDEPTVTGLSEAKRLIPGSTGRIDLSEVGAILQASGFDGPVTPTASHVAVARMQSHKIVQQASKAIDAVINR